MKFKKYLVDDNKKKQIVAVIKNVLITLPEINFAHLHGSFTGKKEFGDIDIAVHLKEKNLPDPVINYEIDLEIMLEEVSKYPVDVRVLNNAPLSFKYQVIKSGKLLFEDDSDSRVEFQTRTLDFYFDFAPFRKQYLKEVLDIGD